MMNCKLLLFTGAILITTAELGAQNLQPAETGFSQPWRESYFNGAPLKIGNETQFLFDDYLVEDKYGLKSVLGEIKKYEGNPLFSSGEISWKNNEKISAGALTHIIYDPKEKLYKGWYLSYRREKSYNYSTLYAESKDGIVWEKPALDFYKINGEKTNLVLHDDEETMLLEEVKLDNESKDPAKRYTGLVKMVPKGEKARCIVLMHSADGKKWTMGPDAILFRGASDGSYSLVRDEKKDRWLLYRRPATNALTLSGDGIYTKNPLRPEKKGVNVKRRLGVTISKDLKNWSYPRSIAILDDTDEIHQIIGNKMDVDWVTVTRYQDLFLGFLHPMDNLAIAIPQNNQLMWSRDGLEWKRLATHPHFIANGAAGEWDAGSIGSINLIPHGDQIRIYYTGSNITQAETRIPRLIGSGLAFLDKDRFIGLQAGPEGGFLLTRQFIVEGDQLKINFQSQVKQPPADWGYQIKAELVQQGSDQVAAVPYPGFSLKDCDPITQKEGADYVVTWKGGADISALKGKAVYVRFYLQNTALFNFKVDSSSAGKSKKLK